MTQLSEMPEFLAGYLRGYAHGVEHRLNPPTRVDLEAAEPLSFTEWSEVKRKREAMAARPGGTAAETSSAPELAEEHASRAALANARSVPPPQVRPLDAAPSAAGRAAVRSDEVIAAMESAVLAMIQVFRDNHLTVAASLCQRSLSRLHDSEGS